MEQIRFTASVDGVYKVEVIPILFAGDTAADFALAGVDGPSVQSGCLGGGAAFNGQSPAAVPALQQTASNPVVLTGCGFTGTSFVTVNGLGVTAGSGGVSVIDDNTIVLNLPVVNAVGQLALVIQTATGPVNGVLNVVPPPPTLQNVNLNLSSFFGPVVRLGSTPGDFYFLVASPDLSPSSLPGLYAFDIGAGNTSLLLLESGSIPAGAVVTSNLSSLTLPPGTPPGLNVHFQAGILNGQTLALPLVPTNTGTSVTVN